MDHAEALATSERGAMIAAAGHGKTHLIAEGVLRFGGKRELILTHTHAGVNAIRSRLAKLKVSQSRVDIDTIAAWTLRIATAFPKKSAVPTASPKENSEYAAICDSTTKLLASPPIRQIITASYSGVYIDEYQDCTTSQHAAIVALASILPCRIVGDPLQGIFDFRQNGSPAISWTDHVLTAFVDLPGPTIPRRWENTSPELGDWLTEVRERIEHRESIDLRAAPPCVVWREIADPRQGPIARLQACRDAAQLAASQNVVAIYQWRPHAYKLASALNGLYACVEPIDQEDLYEAAAQIDAARLPTTTNPLGGATALLTLAGKCIKNVRGELATMRTALEAQRIPTRLKKHRGILDRLLRLADGDLSEIRSVLGELSQFGTVYRRDPVYDMMRAATALLNGEASTLLEAAWRARNLVRHNGRRLARRAIGTPLLVKGLEFDHAILLDAEGFQTPQNLYVALTRATRTLTVLSTSRTIRVGALGPPPVLGLP